MEHLANYDCLVRQILGLSPVRAPEEKPFPHKTLSENVCQVDELLLQQINTSVVQAGRAVFKKKENGAPEPIRAKADTYVLETNIHFPTDLNLLWDAQRKCADLLRPWVRRYEWPGWRKVKVWRSQLKGQMIGLTRLLSGGGPNKAQRSRAAVEAYVQSSYAFEQKFNDPLRVWPAPADPVEVLQREQLDYFHTQAVGLGRTTFGPGPNHCP